VPATSILFGVLLIVLGLGGYFGTGTSSPTALIPAGFGAVLVLLGAVAWKDNLRKHAMHAASMVAVVGFIGAAIMAFPKLPTLLSTGEVIRADGTNATIAVIAQLIMAGLCLVFLALCVNSFISARRRRKAQTVEGASPTR